MGSYERRYLLLNIVPCETKKQWRLFENIPEILHEGNRYFLPPFPGSVSRLARRSHPFHNHGELFPFIAYRDGRPVDAVNRWIWSQAQIRRQRHCNPYQQHRNAVTIGSS